MLQPYWTQSQPIMNAIEQAMGKSWMAENANGHDLAALVKMAIADTAHQSRTSARGALNG